MQVLQTPERKLTKKIGLVPKEALVSTFLVANAFVWYLTGFSYLQETASSYGGNSLLFVVAANFSSLVLSAFVVSLFTNKFKHKLPFFKSWVFVGVLLSILFVAVNEAGFLGVLAMSCVIGMYFGIGMPACMDYFAKTTLPQSRAKLGGLVVLLIGVCFPLISIIGSIELFLLADVLAVWRILGLFFVLGIKPFEKQAETNQKVTFRSVISSKTFRLYAAPWFMFSLINDLTMQINTNHFSSGIFGQNYMLIENVVAGASAIICGILADKKGRKRFALMGFALLGVGYASLGLFSGNYFAEAFYIFADGIAWGAFSMLFLITIWGDIAQSANSEKFYFLGVLPYLFSNLARLLMGSYLSSSMGEAAVFSFASFFLFIAILPLVYAPETLSDKLLFKLEIDSYVNKALEKVKKDRVKIEEATPK